MKKNTYKFIDINRISPNKDQPRTHFEDEKIQELAESIKVNGLLQPIVVRPYGGFKQYQIVVGERRYRACKLAGIKEVPVLIQKLNDEETANAALVENIQRENLSPIEEALAYASIMDSQNLTQAQVAEKMGKKQSTIANKLRLLKLSPTVQQALKEKQISERHGRALLKIENISEQNNLLKKIIANNLTVEETERLVKATLEPPKKKKKGTSKALSQNVQIALNTLPLKDINKAVKTINDFGIDTNVDEEETDDAYVITIKIKK
ncbi:ParB/RepB/Spo0J family partition protein [Intestinibaculum porci]|jgi:ParB family chromosome partitioning protein|uniref:Nucleoid occlusion protein n=1 Tax=Intestinibaculum porci TaxID=2487118 RepID=A0A3G9JMB6_9FIRM|nr:ParB/RepB/Spo0J family partition protein [Intestinibaculum porci]MDD6350243.1 ParB/RepB/Spo0J family partition protein [Intestinibaculum porci]MDD6422641.1 ParB/RepB/Spo0J family partition protein [Intestinibaculum porci]BBH25338.1 nucleoid occlusion protein [Intestinibaculum porci]HAN57709.1 nucleoid occlusion protein [Erysipelotrichaceae bacterium]